MTDPETLVSADAPPEDFELVDPIHPGIFLKEILDELEINHAMLAAAIGVSQESVTAIVNCQRPITADLALLIGKALYMTAETWMNLQKMYDLEAARLSTDTSFIVPLVPPPDDTLLQAPTAKFISL